MSSRIIISIFFNLLLAGPLVGQKPELSFKHLSSTQGLSHSTVYAVSQDYKGFMWFGTEDGLSMYDGNSFTVYRNLATDSLSISHNNVKVIFEDSNQDLWIGTFGGGLNLYDREKDGFVVFKNTLENPNSLNNNYVEVIYEDSKGNLWIGTPSGLNKYNKKEKRFTLYIHDPNDPKSLSDNRITAIHEDLEGNLWIGTMKGLNLLDQESGESKKYFHQPDNKESLSHNHVTEINQNKQGALWIGTSGGGLNLFKPETKTFSSFKHDLQDPNSIGSNIIYDLFFDQQNNLWIGTENGGLNLFDPLEGIFYHYTPDEADKSSLSNYSVNSILEDSSGTLWLGLYNGGINYYNPIQQKFSLHTVNPLKNSLNNNNVKAFYEDKEGAIWIGTDGGGLNVLNRKTNTFTFYQPLENNPGSLSSYAVQTIMEDSKGNLWIGTYGGGLNLFDRKTKEFTHYRHNPEDPNSLSSDNVAYIMEDKQGELWIATSGGGINRFNKTTNTFTHYNCGGPEAEKTGSCWVNSLLQDSRGNIWIATSWGLNLFDDQTDTFIHFHTDENSSQEHGNISSEDVYTLLEDHTGNLWVGTKKGLNLYDYDSKTFRAYNTTDGLPSNVVTNIKEDGQGNLWLGTFQGLSLFNPTDKTFKNFGVSDGLQGDEFLPNASLITQDGAFLFGGTSGFNLFYPDSLKSNTYIPPVYITSFSIFNKPVAIGENSILSKCITESKEIILSYKESVFSFEFAALNYIDSKNNQYAYMMEGFDKEWNYVGKQRSATYTNLDPGNYSFRVKASNNDGAWNEEGTFLSLIITPPFWQTWWFRLLLAFTVIGSAFTFYRVRINAVKAQQAKLEKQVKEKTADLQLANNDLTERQEEIMQQQEELQAQAELLQDSNDNLKNTQEEIAVQRDHLKIMNEQMMSSIQYAQTIQNAILPSQERISKAFPENFIIYRPKDVVSGDFYWFTQISREDSGLPNDLTLIALVDCTGHGVPGAFMSIIGSTLLNEIVNQKQLYDPAQILEQLDMGVKATIKNAKGINTAGMDACLCSIEKGVTGQVKILFSGAKRNLLYVKAGTQKVDMLLADRRSIGSDSTSPFTTQELVLDSGSMVYLTSDGYADQNNKARDKLGSKKLSAIISKTSKCSPNEQKQVLEKTLDEHQEGSEQRDDISLIGMKL